MRILIKIFKSGERDRVSRIHTLRGELIPVSDILLFPYDLALRILGIRRKSPWLSRQAIRQLKSIVEYLPELRVLEIGGGQSSRYFSDHAVSLLTIEENGEWAKKIKGMVNPACNFNLEIGDTEKWLLTRNSTNLPFDIVLIDGATDVVRKKALEILPTLNSTAVYVLDNSDRRIFDQLAFKNNPIKIIRKRGLIRHPLQATETSFYWFE